MDPQGLYDTIFKQAVVIDNGSGLIKAGLAGEDRPTHVFPSYVGRPKHKKVLPGSIADPEYFVGIDAEQNRGLMKLQYCIRHGVVDNWADMENIWKHLYNTLGILPQDHPVLLTEAPLNPYANREKAAEILFETFGVPGLFVAVQAVLSLYSSGATTGVVLDCGDGVTHCVPVYEGYSLAHAIGRIDLGGRDITNHLQLLLRRSGHIFYTSAELELVRQIKEKVCHVSTVYSKEDDLFEDSAKNVTSVTVQYNLPDGQAIKIGPEKFRAPEVLFTPERIGIEYPGVQELLVNSINRADLDLRRDLFSSIYLAGGSTMFTGFPERLLNELRRLSAKDTKIRINAPDDRKISCWLGGSILSSLGAFKHMWIRKQDYEEEGKRVLHSKTI